jgi:hypothetical protein
MDYDLGYIDLEEKTLKTRFLRFLRLPGTYSSPRARSMTPGRSPIRRVMVSSLTCSIFAISPTVMRNVRNEGFVSEWFLQVADGASRGKSFEKL